MEWTVKLEAKGGWSAVQTFDIGRVSRRVHGLTAAQPPYLHSAVRVVPVLAIGAAVREALRLADVLEAMLISNRSLPLDPASGSRVSPVVATAICMKPRPLLTERQIGMLAVLKEDVPSFVLLRRLAIHFRSLLQHRDETKLEPRLIEAKGCGIPAVMDFARTPMLDIQAVRNAVIEPWSNGQTEGQINRLKVLKHAMYGRASATLLSAWMRPLREVEFHQV